MRLTVIGGGGFRVPLVYRALAAGRPGAPEADEVVLHDVDPARVDAIARVLAALGGPPVRVEPHLDEALRGADAVFSAVRVGGTAGRVTDERVALSLGQLGQETVGAGGIAYALRTVPFALALARRIHAGAPGAWVVNFTNPAGIVTEAMHAVLGDRVIGICDSPAALARRAARALGVDPAPAIARYAGLNHLGWLLGLEVDGIDRLPELLASDHRLASFEEGRLFGGEVARAVGGLPNEYLWYHYARDDAREAVLGAPATRGEVVRDQQAKFYDTAADATPEAALRAWLEALRAREETYFAEGRGGSDRDAADVGDEGYEGVALDLLGALSGKGERLLVLNVLNVGGTATGSAVPCLPADAVVEVTCSVGTAGARPERVPVLSLHQQALLAAVKASERAVIEACEATTYAAARAAALRAFAFSPLVGSFPLAERLLDAYLEAGAFRLSGS